MKTRLLILVAITCLLAVGGADEKKSASKTEDELLQTENVKNYIGANDFVVDICIYEQEWQPPTRENWKGTLVQRAVTTHVHKGDIAIGTKLEYEHYIENPPKFFGHFRSVVEGELKVFFFCREDATFKDGKYTIAGDAHFSFSRLGEGASKDFIQAFQRELETDPSLQRKGRSSPKSEE
jgi:hypothetical protein